ncbi:MAG: hypothetical protein II427_02910, partial [Firmicutes bacterium]|nr:hypothetical protein [Bacillota bacterium]
YRVYKVNGATTLYTLHKQIRADLEFPQDQLIMFKALDVTGAVVGRYGLFDLGWGTADQISLEKAIKANAGPLLESVKLFDVYRGAPVLPGFKSVAYSLTYRAADRTLKENEVNEINQKVLIALKDAYNAVLREM